jgi:sortase A
MGDRRSVDDLSIDELEQILLLRRREVRAERMRRMGRHGSSPEDLVASLRTTEEPEPPPIEPKCPSEGRFRPLAVKLEEDESPKRLRRINFRWVRDSALLILEVVALAGLVIVLLVSAANLKTLNQEVALAREPTPTAFPTSEVQIRVSMLPGGHSPPSAGNPVPQRLADMVQPVVPVPIPTPGPQSPTRIVIPAILVDAPVVAGDDWEQLKKGAGHHLGSANPGERGNCFISAHNDIFGEIFRRLEDVELQDEITVYAGETPYRYIVKAKRIVEPTDVSVIATTASPVLTLMTCYPYMIDTHRLVVIAELAD